MPQNGKNSKTILEELRKKEEEDLAKALAPKHGIPYLDLSRATIDLDALKLIPETDARAYSLAAFQAVGKKIEIALTNPDRLGVAEILENLKRKKYETQLFLVSPASLERVIARYREIPKFEEMKAGVVDISKPEFASFEESVKSVSKLKTALDTLVSGKNVRQAAAAMELILAGGIQVEASDIHLEAEEKSARLRLRLDGVLQDIIDFPLPLFQLMVSRIKLVAEMKLNIHDKPQDGRFTVQTKKENIEVRVSSLPGPYGESIVMRLLLPKSIATTLENLGMQPLLLTLMLKEIERPNGMILTTGPTGSGKTTTLYAFLKKLASPEVKVITIEDPIEYHIPHITQTQVDHTKGYDFASGLRSIVRQDPDIILVGEIRDLETADIAIQAALTGHLVLSTLHTNDAAGVFPRLIDLGVKPGVIPPAVNVAMAQRLLRRICTNCKRVVDPTPEEAAIIRKSVEKTPPAFRRILDQNFKMWRGGGCEDCNFTGFKGRIGVYEAFLVDDEMERLILKNPPEADIKEAALKQGMLTMYQDGILKVIDGITTIDELERVVSAD